MTSQGSVSPIVNMDDNKKNWNDLYRLIFLHNNKLNESDESFHKKDNKKNNHVIKTFFALQPLFFEKKESTTTIYTIILLQFCERSRVKLTKLKKKSLKVSYRRIQFSILDFRKLSTWNFKMHGGEAGPCSNVHISLPAWRNCETAYRRSDHFLLIRASLGQKNAR